MGTVCGIILADNGYQVHLWGAFPDNIQDICKHQENRKFLPGFKLPARLQANTDARQVLSDAQLIVSAVPCQYIRRVWEELTFHLEKSTPIISVTKGIEIETLLRPSQILAEMTGPDRSLGALSGPTIAGELAQQLPATAVVASSEGELAKIGQSIFTSKFFRLYTNNDLLGVELAGASKNVIALAAGIIDGLKLGDNAKAALLTRGLVEITRLGIALGAEQQTFAGLAGLGDLVTTCISPMGRNRSVGERIGQGQRIEDIISGMSAVAEGVPTTKAVLALAKRHNVDMPITAKVHAVLFEEQQPPQAIAQLMSRTPKPER